MSDVVRCCQMLSVHNPIPSWILVKKIHGKAQVLPFDHHVARPVGYVVPFPLIGSIPNIIGPTWLVLDAIPTHYLKAIGYCIMKLPNQVGSKLPPSFITVNHQLGIGQCRASFAPAAFQMHRAADGIPCTPTLHHLQTNPDDSQASGFGFSPFVQCSCRDVSTI